MREPWFDVAGQLDVDAMPRRAAHAVYAVFAASRDLRMPPTAAEACHYDEEAISVKATAAALREAAKHGLVVCAGGVWFVAGAALHTGRIPFDERVSRDYAEAQR